MPFNTHVYVTFNNEPVCVAQLDISYVPAYGELINIRAFLNRPNIAQKPNSGTLQNLLERNLLVVRGVTVIYRPNGVEHFEIETDFWQEGVR